MQRFVARLGIQLNRVQKVLWGASVVCILITALVTRTDGLTLSASLVGVTSLIFAAVGGLLGPILMIAFSILYGIISWQMAYYGEMITYLGMTAPMSLAALVAWVRHPAPGGHARVQVAKLGPATAMVLCVTTCVVTYAFYYILEILGTASLTASTLSVATSYVAAFLTWRRSPLYAIGYAANDVVLIVLWCAALPSNTAYISVVVCFAVFLVNDLYGYVCWRTMQKQQSRAT